MPNDVTYSEEESMCVHEDGSIMKNLQRILASATHEERAFIDAFEKMIVAICKEEHVIASMRTDNAYYLSVEKLSRIWGIGIPAVRQKLKATMQKSVRTGA
jgi:hypothetical protein